MGHSEPTSPSANAVRWVARISGALLVGFLALFIAAHGGPPNVFTQPAPVQLEFLAVAAIAIGAVVGWWRQIGGGILSLAGFVLFSAVELVVNGTMPGGVIPLFCIPGVSLVLAGLLTPQTRRQASLN